MSRYFYECLTRKTFSDHVQRTWISKLLLKKEMLPKPNQSLIEFKEEPAKTVAVISFNGWANDKKIEKYKQKLKSALDEEGISYSDRFYFFDYNPPYEVFNRKNEVIVELH